MSGVSTKIDSTKRLTTKKQREGLKMNLCNEFSQITSQDFFLNESVASKENSKVYESYMQ